MATHLDEVWQSEAMKAGGPALVAAIRYLLDGQEALLTGLNQVSELCKKTELRMEAFVQAFPGGDLGAHRRYHEELIENLQWKKRFYREMLEHLMKGGLWALALFLVTCIGLGIRKWMFGA